MPRNPRDAAPKRPTEKPANGAANPSAAQVADYLRRNPDFLSRNPDVLATLTVPGRARGDGVVDLQCYMVDRLRDEVAQVTAGRDALIEAGRSNMAAQSRVHQAVLALLTARSFEHLIEIATTDLAVMLNLDAVMLGVEQTTRELPPVRLGGICQLDPDTVDSVIGPGRALVLRGDVEGDPAIFGAAAGLVCSQALIRLSISRATPDAMLALGSRRAEQFQPGQGTELLTFLGGALERCIRGWLDLPD